VHELDQCCKKTTKNGIITGGEARVHGTVIRRSDEAAGIVRGERVARVSD